MEFIKIVYIISAIVGFFIIVKGLKLTEKHKAEQFKVVLITLIGFFIVLFFISHYLYFK